MIETKFKKNTIKTNSNKNFGNPLRECPYCKKSYLDDTVQEPALLSPFNLLFKGISSASSTIASSVLLSILLGSYAARIMSGDMTMEIGDAAAIKIIAPLAIVITAVAFKVIKPMNLKSEVAASLERLKDQEYLKTLVRLKKDIVQPDSAYAKAKGKK
jgi:integral membrane sensor domain MASE1